MKRETTAAAEEIIIEDLGSADILILQTANHTYDLTMTDPAERQALLAGGAYGKIAVPAVLSPSCRLREGEKLYFFILSTVESLFLKTTDVKHLRIIKNGGPQIASTSARPNRAARLEGCSNG